MKVTLHQTHHTIADFDAIFNTLKSSFTDLSSSGLHLFPELFLTGYPLQDLCIQKPFIDTYHEFLGQIDSWSENTLREIYQENQLCILAGGLHYDFDDKSQVKHIFNVIFQITPGKKIKIIYTKQLLPNYDIFDEKKYFTPGNKSFILEWNDKKIATLICEDMWATNRYNFDPCIILSEKINNESVKLDLIINLSASPYNIHKQNKRLERASEISKLLNAPFAYINRVGGEDEIIFDGASFIVNQDKIIKHAKSFAPDILEIDLDTQNWQEGEKINQVSIHGNTWEDLFLTNLQKIESLPTMQRWDDVTATEVLNALIFGLREYARKSGFNKFVIALSGGMDSALTVAIVKLALLPGQTLEAIYMPGMFSAGLSFDLSLKQCQQLGIKLTSLPIKFLHSTCKNLFGQNFSERFEGLTDENIQSRLRGLLLYTRSNQTGAMVINTSNKSEIAVGYSTQYGDSVGAISLLGDLYKTEVYQLAHLINKISPEMIPQEVITRAPSAELRENQEDSQSLPPYERLDVILDCMLSYQYSSKDIINLGFDSTEVNKVANLYQRSEFKRFQFCPILKIKPKSFGFGYRVPLNKNSDFFTKS